MVFDSCIFNCPTKGIPIHAFPNPKKCPILFKKWLDIILYILRPTNCAALSNLSYESIHENYGVCDLHFKREDRTVYNRLGYAAIPSINLYDRNLKSNKSTIIVNSDAKKDHDHSEYTYLPDSTESDDSDDVVINKMGTTKKWTYDMVRYYPQTSSFNKKTDPVLNENVTNSNENATTKPIQLAIKIKNSKQTDMESKPFPIFHKKPPRTINYPRTENFRTKREYDSYKKALSEQLIHGLEGYVDCSDYEKHKKNQSSTYDRLVQDVLEDFDADATHNKSPVVNEHIEDTPCQNTKNDSTSVKQEQSNTKSNSQNIKNDSNSVKQGQSNTKSNAQNTKNDSTSVKQEQSNTKSNSQNTKNDSTSVKQEQSNTKSNSQNNSKYCEHGYKVNKAPQILIQPLDTFHNYTSSTPSNPIIANSTTNNNNLTTSYTMDFMNPFMKDAVRYLQEISQSLGNNEFSVFGTSIAQQLNSLPENVAVELQTKIQMLVTNARLKAFSNSKPLQLHTDATERQNEAEENILSTRAKLMFTLVKNLHFTSSWTDDKPVYNKYFQNKKDPGPRKQIRLETTPPLIELESEVISSTNAIMKIMNADLPSTLLNDVNLSYDQPSTEASNNNMSVPVHESMIDSNDTLQFGHEMDNIINKFVTEEIPSSSAWTNQTVENLSTTNKQKSKRQNVNNSMKSVKKQCLESASNRIKPNYLLKRVDVNMIKDSLNNIHRIGVIKKNPQVSPVNNMKNNPQTTPDKYILNNPQTTPDKYILNNPQTTPDKYILNSPQISPVKYIKNNPQISTVKNITHGPEISPVKNINNDPHISSVKNIKNKSKTSSVNNIKNSPRTSSVNNIKNSPQTQSVKCIKNNLHTSSVNNVKKNTHLRDVKDEVVHKLPSLPILTNAKTPRPCPVFTDTVGTIGDTVRKMKMRIPSSHTDVFRDDSNRVIQKMIDNANNKNFYVNFPYD